VAKLRRQVRRQRVLSLAASQVQDRGQSVRREDCSQGNARVEHEGIEIAEIDDREHPQPVRERSQLVGARDMP
jgi:hypothetical protein